MICGSVFGTGRCPKNELLTAMWDGGMSFASRCCSECYTSSFEFCSSWSVFFCISIFYLLLTWCSCQRYLFCRYLSLWIIYLLLLFYCDTILGGYKLQELFYIVRVKAIFFCNFLRFSCFFYVSLYTGIGGIFNDW